VSNAFEAPMKLKRVVIPFVALSVAFTIAGASWVKHD
jgi:hypothetical protein